MRVSVRSLCLPVVAVAAGLVLAGAPAAAAAPLATGGTLLVGAAAPNVFTPLPTPVTGSAASSRTVSEDGRYVAFGSSDDGLVADDDDVVGGIYRKDRQTGEVLLVSRSTDGAPNHGSCSDPSISRDGTRIAFTCNSALDPADDNGMWDVYVRDVPGQTTTLASRTPAAVSDGLSYDSEISGNGSFVAFESSAANLVPGVSGGHVFRRSLLDGTVELVDQPNTAVANNGVSFDPTISDDGTKVAFTTTATNLAMPLVDGNARNDVYVRTMGGSVAPVSTVNGNATTMANNGGGSPALSGNGQYVAYASTATNAAPGDTDTTTDVHRRTLGSATVQLVSRASGLSGVKGSSSSDDPQIDATGQWIAFASSAPNLDPSAPPTTQIYLRHTAGTYATALVSPGAPAGRQSQHPAISADGATVAFESTGHTPDSDPERPAVFARDVAAEVTTLASRPPGTDPFRNAGSPASIARAGALSADGRYAVFSAKAPGLPGAPGGVVEVWRRDTLTGDVVLASRADGPSGAASDEDAGEATISADGQRVAFEACAANLDPAATDGTCAVYVRDVAAQTTTLVSRRDGPSGVPLGYAGQPAIGADGTRVAFVAQDAALGGTATSHVVVRDLGTHATTAVDTGADAAASRPTLNAAGTRVAWVTEVGGGGSKAGSPVPEPKPAIWITHVWWADVADGTPHQLDAGAPDDADSTRPTLSDDGTRAAFTTRAALLEADQQSGSDVYVRDLITGDLQLVSAGLGGATADAESGTAAISGDGRAVAFISQASNLTADAPNGSVEDVFVRALATGATTLASRADGPGGALLDAYVQSLAVSRDGGCVLFQTAATSLAADLSPAVDRVWLRAVHGTCPVSAPTPPGGAPAGGLTSGGTPPSGGGPAPGTRRPVITRFRARPVRFTRSGRRAGTTLRLRVDRAATITIKIDRLTRGHRKGGRCRAGAGKRRCTAATRVATLRKTAPRAGTVTLRFTAKVGGRPIAPGRYRATATAKDATGTSKPVRLVLRARR